MTSYTIESNTHFKKKLRDIYLGSYIIRISSCLVAHSERTYHVSTKTRRWAKCIKAGTRTVLFSCFIVLMGNANEVSRTKGWRKVWPASYFRITMSSVNKYRKVAFKKQQNRKQNSWIANVAAKQSVIISLYKQTQSRHKNRNLLQWLLRYVYLKFVISVKNV